MFLIRLAHNSHTRLAGTKVHVVFKVMLIRSLSVPLQIYRQLLTLNEASEYNFRGVLQLARTGICHGLSMERCRFGCAS